MSNLIGGKIILLGLFRKYNIVERMDTNSET